MERFAIRISNNNTGEIREQWVEAESKFMALHKWMKRKFSAEMLEEYTDDHIVIQVLNVA